MRVAVGESGGELLIEVRDDGTGFDPETVTVSHGFGLTGMKERVSLVGGTLSIDSGEQGTLIAARLPARRRDLTGEDVAQPESERAAS